MDRPHSDAGRHLAPSGPSHLTALRSFRHERLGDAYLRPRGARVVGELFRFPLSAWVNRRFSRPQVGAEQGDRRLDVSPDRGMQSQSARSGRRSAMLRE